MKESDFITTLKFYNTSDTKETTYILCFKCKHIILCQVTMVHTLKETLSIEKMDIWS